MTGQEKKLGLGAEVVAGCRRNAQAQPQRYLQRRRAGRDQDTGYWPPETGAHSLASRKARFGADRMTERITSTVIANLDQVQRFLRELQGPGRHTEIDRFSRA
jgi:hypothetical protein